MIKKANREKWRQQKDEAYNKAAKETQQKTISVATDNAVIAQRIKAKLLKRLEKEIDALPENIGTESSKIVADSKFEGKNRMPSHTEEIKRAYKLRDLTAAYKDLTDDMPKEQSNPALERLDQMLAEVKNIAAHS